ncbi:MAG: peptidoglycan recognition family protein [Chloroherpetonaceae bacterium]|nr:peptidoglycan recognition family protein [Chloroherpetonaceae bacterium]
MELYLPFAPLLAALGVMLTLSLAVERFLEIGSWLFDQLFLFRIEIYSSLKRDLEKEQLAFKEASELDEIRSFNHDLREIPPNPNFSFVEKSFDLLPMPIGNRNSITKEFWLNTLGCFVGIAGCKFSNFSIFTFLPFGNDSLPNTVLGMVLTGIIIGAGSKPVHFLIRFITERKLQVSRPEKIVGYRELLSANPSDEHEQINSESASIPSATVKQTTNGFNSANALKNEVLTHAPISLETLVGYLHHQGVHSKAIEHSHQRTAPIDLIVYHHTAMNSSAPFSEVIKEFERKKWLAGYHAVVFQNGAIEILTRWDRRGNHAAGYNFRSLGLAFQGNYETNPKVPFSNVNGRLGSSQATLPQLHAAARVIALWHFLYQVPLEFPQAVSDKKVISKAIKGIVPHRHLAFKACPGESFQFDLFQQTIVEYVTAWKKLDGFETALKNFKTQPYL